MYNPDVRVYDVTDANGKPLALFIADFYARGNKHGGAWMNEYVSQSSLWARMANQLNIPKPPAGQPTLLTFDEVTTMFHEFGHALHGMSNVKYPRFAGTSVPSDFVYPSQVNEMWAVWPEVRQRQALPERRGHAAGIARQGHGGEEIQPGLHDHGIPVCWTSAGTSWRRARSRPTCWPLKRHRERRWNRIRARTAALPHQLAGHSFSGGDSPT